MDVKRGQVVKALAGRDKESGFLVVLEVQPPFAFLCDGKRRPLARPKRKKLIHLAPAKTIIPEEALQTDRKIRAALRDFQQGPGRDGN